MPSGAHSRNQAWPALYFIDAQGRVRHHFFGEGSYEQSEMVIQALLREAGATDVSREPVAVNARGHDAAPDWANLKSPENYVGFERTENFASPGGVLRDKPRMYQPPARLSLNEWALSGDWTVKRDAAALNKAGGSITYRFHARDLHLVMGPAVRGSSVKFRVLIDGQPPGAAHGVDVDEQGYGTVTEQRMYTLIRQPGPIADRQFEIEFFGSGRGGLRLHVRLTRRATANSISQRITGVSRLPGVGVEQVESIEKTLNETHAPAGATEQEKEPCRPPPKASQS